MHNKFVKVNLIIFTNDKEMKSCKEIMGKNEKLVQAVVSGF